MATVKVGLKIDTQQAQQNVDRLKKRAVEIEKQLQKRLKLKLDTQDANRALNSLQNGVSSKGGGGAKSSLSSLRNLKGGGGGGGGFGSGLLSNMGGLKGIGAAAGVAAVATMIFSIVKSTEAFQNFTRALNAGKESLLSPGKEVATRVADMGALDDRARAAGVSRGEQYAFEKATEIAFGQDSTNMLGRVTSAIAEAITGNEQKTAAVRQLGLTYDDLANKSEQQQFMAVMAAADRKLTNPTSEQDRAATVDALRQIVGARGINTFLGSRGEVGNMQGLYKQILGEYNTAIKPYQEQAMLEADDKHEMTKVRAQLAKWGSLTPYDTTWIDLNNRGIMQEVEMSNKGLHTASRLDSSMWQMSGPSMDWYNKQYRQNSEMKNLTSAVSSLNNTIKEADAYNKQRDNQQVTAPATFS